MQVYYLSSSSEDGSDPEYDKLGWKELEEYDPSQQRWKCLASLVEGGDVSEHMVGDTDEMTINDYYASLPFAALFSACKVWFISASNNFITRIGWFTVTTSLCLWQAKGLKVSCVLCYCSEGDNMPESFHLAAAVCKLLGHGPEKFHGTYQYHITLIPLCFLFDQVNTNM
jgi:proteasome assembly chaperone 2